MTHLLCYVCISVGVRLYFSTTPFAPLHQKHAAVRPSLLALVHVRLPPGFSASSTLQKPAKVHKALHSKGLFFLRLPGTNSILWYIEPTDIQDKNVDLLVILAVIGFIPCNLIEWILFDFKVFHT